MFFNGNATANRRLSTPAPGEISPRFARVLQESIWLLVGVAVAYLALILVTYTRADPGWSFSGTGAPIGNRGVLGPNNSPSPQASSSSRENED